VHAASNPENILQIPFGTPVDTRQLALVQPASRVLTRLDQAIKKIFTDLPD